MTIRTGNARATDRFLVQITQQKVPRAALDINLTISGRSPRLKAAGFDARQNRHPSIEPLDAQVPRAMRASGEGNATAFAGPPRREKRGAQHDPETAETTIGETASISPRI